MNAANLTISWAILTPELALILIALAVLVLDFMTGVRGSKPTLGMMSIFALLVALVILHTNDQIGFIGASFVLDPFAILFKTIIMIGAALVILMSMHYLRQNPEIYQGEFYYLILFATAGAMLMVSSADLITLYIGLEILSIASYVLAGFKTRSTKSNEAAMKYLVLGGTASAFILFGMSYIYGLTGTTNLVEIGSVITQVFVSYTFLVSMAILFMLVGFGFKLAIAPFHMWAPDVYEGAPTPITAFLAAVSKVAAFAFVLRIMALGFGPIFGAWYFYIAILAAVSMFVGNIIALRQTNIKRLLAYSGIAQAGYLLVPIGAAITWDLAFSQILFYGIGYILAIMGIFAIIVVVGEDSRARLLGNKEDLLATSAITADNQTSLDVNLADVENASVLEGTADPDAIESYRGLYYRSPLLAIAMTVFLVSLAGLPVTAGFFGKFYIFLGAMTNEMYWLALVMALTSIISFYYYFQVIRVMFLEPALDSDLVKVELLADDSVDGPADEDSSLDDSLSDDELYDAEVIVERLVVPNSILVVIISALVLTIGLGAMPGLVTNFLIKVSWIIF